MPSVSEGIPKHCEAVSETSGWSPISITKPRGLSFLLAFASFANDTPNSIIENILLIITAFRSEKNAGSQTLCMMLAYIKDQNIITTVIFAPVNKIPH